MKKYLGISLLSLRLISAFKAMEGMDSPAAAAADTPLRTVGRPTTDHLLGSPLGNTPPRVLTPSQRQGAQLDASFTGSPILTREEQISPLRAFVQGIEFELGHVPDIEGILSWRESIIPRVDRFPGGSIDGYITVNIEDFQQAGSPYVWGFDLQGRPFIAVAYTVEYVGPMAAALSTNSDEIFIQIFFLRYANVQGNWAPSGTGMLVRGRQVTEADFSLLAELIIDKVIKSNAHGVRAFLRLANIENKQ